MVRLLLTPLYFSAPHKFWFQSHNGAIAAPQSPKFDAQLAQFQSHNGAIAAGAGGTVRLARLSRFNPTMVRLLPASQPKM